MGQGREAEVLAHRASPRRCDVVGIQVQFSELLNRLHACVADLADRRYWPAVLALWCAMLTVNGVAGVRVYMRLAQDPYTFHPGQPPYTQDTILWPVLAHALGATSFGPFLALAGVIVLLGVVYFAGRARREYGACTGLLLTTLLLWCPLLMVLVSWLGQPDGLTFLLTAVALFSASPITYCLVGFLGSLNHVVMAPALLGLLTVKTAARDKGSGSWHWGGVLLGLALGAICGHVFHVAYGIPEGNRWEAAANGSLSGFLGVFATHLPQRLLSFFGSLWPAITLSLVALWFLDRRYVLWFGLVVTACLGATFLTMDQTRVFSLASWGAGFYTLAYSIRKCSDSIGAGGGGVCQKALLVLVLLAVVFPRYYAWDYRIVPSPSNYPVLLRALRTLPAILKSDGSGNMEGWRKALIGR